MPITLLDGILVGFTLVSAMLAMVRGFSREVLSVASWIAAAAAAYFFYPAVLPYVQPHIDNEKIAMGAAAGIVFLVGRGVFRLGFVILVFVVILELAVLDRGDVVLLAGVDFLDAGKIGLVGFGFLVVAELVFGGAQRGFFFRMGALFRQQSLSVRLRDLVIVRVYFAEGEEAVTVPPEIDERRLKRRFYPRNLGEIDIALDLLVFGRFEIEFFNPVALEHGHPGFFRVARIDQHAGCH